MFGILICWALVLGGFVAVGYAEISPWAAPAPQLAGGGNVLNQTQCAAQDLNALRAFKDEVSNFDQSLWKWNESCCSWEGVTCGENSRPRVLSLPSMALRGRISPWLGNLTALQVLNLSGNNFYGFIPGEISKLLNLEVVDLSMNNLSGPISFVADLQQLRFFNASSNLLEGLLPTFQNLISLEDFSVKNNSLQGPIDFGICLHVPNARTLEFSMNTFTELIEMGLGNCTRLEVLNVELNHLTGSIPDDIFNLGSLRQLSMQHNLFNGGLNDGVGKLANLTELSLAFNRLDGLIPRSLSDCTKLKLLSLSNNAFSGPINLDCEKLKDLVTLDLSANNLNGSIPPSLANCTGLQTLNFGENQLTGEIPAQFQKLQKLVFLSISSNFLTGSLSALVECSQLVSLILSKNAFAEPLPGNFTGFTKLQVLALGHLSLTGSLPVWLKLSQNLQVLDLSWNRLSGSLPEWLGNFQHLFYLDLSNNSFQGSIPPQLFGLSALMHEDKNASSLQPVKGDFAVKHQPNSPYLDYTQPTALPPSIYLSHNHLTGSIPREVGNLKMLVNLDLSSNNLTGSIPETLSDARVLEFLDVSENNLTGVIPQTLTLLTFLSVFNASYNNLLGPIPQGNQFSTFTNTSYEGNPGLCGNPLSRACKESRQPVIAIPTQSTYVHSGKARRNAILTITIPVVFLLATLMVISFLWSFCQRNMVYRGQYGSRKTEVPGNLSEALNLPIDLFHSHGKLTVADLLRATNNFDSANIVGCGGFGLVYRADLGNGSKLAIKKLTGDCGQMEREFTAEVEALSKAQHKNLVSLQGHFSVGNDRLLIYSYMENGSLDYWLHEKGDGGTRLNWPIRLKIAQGAACGLAYLHQICNPHIVHRDIKSSNILLDEKFEAHLADFGLARLMMPTDTHVTTELVGTLGYIPPEYGHALNATLMGDVYSFGVVVLELLTRKRPVDVCKAREAGDLVAWVQQMRCEGKSEEIFDNLLQKNTYEEQMLLVLDIACQCINTNPHIRPSIKDIVSWLDKVEEDNRSAKFCGGLDIKSSPFLLSRDG